LVWRGAVRQVRIFKIFFVYIAKEEIKMIWTINLQVKDKKTSITEYYIDVWFFLLIPIYIKIHKKYYL